jgi:hypothetical protein
VEGDNPLFRYAASQPKLVRYCEQMRARYFPETLRTLPRLAAASPQRESAVAPQDSLVV